jgi:FkbM family methyltransferase
LPMATTMTVKVPLFSKLLIALAQNVHYLPIGRNTISTALTKLATFGNVTPSLYGPLLKARWHDLTFQFCASGYYGRYLSDFLRQRSKPFSFIDIGANIGLYTLIAAQNRNCHRCYAFEPNPAIFSAMVENIKLNGCANVQPINAAVSDTVGILRFSAREGHSGAGSLNVPDGTTAISVASVNKDIFDQFAIADTTSKIIKIDVEGHEPIVVAELIKSVIWKQVRFLFLECDESRYDVAALVQLLETSGLQQIYKNGNGKPYDLMFERK